MSTGVLDYLIQSSVLSSAPSVVAPRLSATAEIFTNMFPNTSGDVAFVYPVVARFAERLLDVSREEATALASTLLGILDATPQAGYWPTSRG